MPAPLKTFIIYARADEAFKNQLLRHLRPLRSISVWHDGDILPGEEWDTAIKRELKASELVLFLVSADSLNSDYIQSKELKTALELLQRGQARLVPIVVAPCAWRFDPIISGLQALPLYGGEGVKPVRSWPDPDEAWASVVEHLGDMVEEIQRQRIHDAAKTAIAAQQKAQQEAERMEREKADHAAFDSARSIADLENYLKNFSLHAAEARQRLAAIKQEEEEKRAALAELHTRRDTDAFTAATRTNTAAAYDEYLRLHPGGLHEYEARLRRKEALRRERAGTPAGFFSAKNIAFAIGLLGLSIAGINYCGKENSDSSQAAQSTADKPPADNMVFIKGGSFQMGSSDGSSDERPVHSVTVSDFYLGKYEVTFDEYDLFCAATGREKPADEGWGRGKRPVINVSWDDAKAYCAWLSKQSGKNYRLPTEAEWEYAAREGGRNVRFGNGKDIADPAEINFDGSAAYKKDYSVAGVYRQKTVPVGSLRSPNDFGLHDMSGNVWEWCEDWYHSDYKGAPTDGSAWLSPAGSIRVVRGGSWINYPLYVRAAFRYNYAPGFRFFNLGFRLARTN